MGDRWTGWLIDPCICGEHVGYCADLRGWVTGWQVNVLFMDIYTTHFGHCVDHMGWVTGWLIKIVSHGYVGNILVNVSTLWDEWQVNRLAYWALHGTLWSLCRPYGVSDRSTGWHIEPSICMAHCGHCVDPMGWVTGHQVDILSLRYVWHILVTVATLWNEWQVDI